jgi:hypothetical protein
MLGAARRATFMSNLGGVLLGLLILAVVALLGVFLLYPYFNAWLSGGTTWTPKHFTQLETPTDPIYFLSTELSLGGDTGWYEETRYAFIPIGQDHFGVALIDEGMVLITKSGDPLPEFERPTVLTGTLKPFDTLGSDIRRSIMSELSGLESYPLVLDMTEAENKVLWVVGAVAVAAGGLFGAFTLLRSIGRSFNPSSHPIWKNLTRFNLPPEDVLRGIEADRDSGVYKAGQFELTRRWAVAKGSGKLQVAKVQDLVWAYGYVQSGRYGSLYFVKAYDRDGVELMAQLKKKEELDPTLSAIQKAVPWVLIGNNAEAEKIWKKNRAEFLRQIDERKRQMQTPA